MAYYAVFDAEGELIQYVSNTDGLDETWTTELLDEDFDIVTARWVDGAWTTDPTAHITALKTSVHQQAEVAASQYVTVTADSSVQPLIYAAKLLEVYKWRSLDGAAQAALTNEEKLSGWPMAYYDAEVFEDTLEDAIARFEQGAGPSILNIAQIEAQRQKTLADIRAANSSSVTMDEAADGFGAVVDDASGILEEDGDPLTDEFGASLTI